MLDMHRYSPRHSGGTLLGFVFGLVVGLGVALAVAVYVTKAPISFVNKVSAPSAEPDVVEAEKNRNWDPNAPLHGKKPQRSAAGAVAASESQGDVAAVVATVVPSPAKAQRGAVEPTAADPLGDFAHIHAAREPQNAQVAKVAPVAPVTKVDTPAQPTQASASKPATLFTYFVQLGAYRTEDEAENQRAKLSLDGLETQVSHRDQGGKTVYRVRMGPYDDREQAERVKSDLEARGMDTALVRVQH
ncbi:SPOR domain-containing protein [Candidatus Symbiobacter mobilis]|nr:SPOR domain-containing protein [Candidatus Symbiobacter mobilis]